MKYLIIQIGDIHYNVGDKEVFIKVLKKVQNLIISNYNYKSYENYPLILMFNGDIARSGEKQQYDEIFKYIKMFYEEIKRNVFLKK